MYSQVKNGDIAIFGHFKDLDIWIPFEYDFQKSVKIIPKMTVEKSFGVEDTYFYERYVLAGNSDYGFCIELSDNLTVDLKHDKFIFEIKSDIEGVMRDINFWGAVCHGHRLISGGDNICEYSAPLFGSDMKQIVPDKKLICGAEILLENKRNARKCLDEMALEDREEFKKYPIYNLIK